MVGQALVGAAVQNVRRLPGADLPAGRQGFRLRAICLTGKERIGGMTRRVFQTTVVNKPVKMWGVDRIDRCWDCGRFLGEICHESGFTPKYPISGVIPEYCPLPNAPEEGNES